MKVLCPECGAPMVLRYTKKFRYKDGSPRPFFGCSQFPDCKASHGAHPDGKPLGRPGTPEEKKARHEAHLVFDAMAERLGLSKKARYKWLQVKINLPAEQAHIGNFGVEECGKLIALCETEASSNLSVRGRPFDPTHKPNEEIIEDDPDENE